MGNGALAIVTHTGARSTRGTLLRGLLFGTPLKLQFASESKIVLALLMTIALIDFTIVNVSYGFSMSSIMTVYSRSTLTCVLSVGARSSLIFSAIVYLLCIDSRQSPLICSAIVDLLSFDSRSMMMIDQRVNLVLSECFLLQVAY